MSRLSAEDKAFFKQVQKLELDPKRQDVILARLRKGVTAWPNQTIPDMWDIADVSHTMRLARPDDYCSSNLLEQLDKKDLIRLVNGGRGEVAGHYTWPLIGVKAAV